MTTERDPVGALVVLLKSFDNLADSMRVEAARDRARIVPAKITPWNEALARRTDTCSLAMREWLEIATPVLNDLTTGYVNRPHWAQGHTSDGVAAQVSYTALSALWKALGVKDQTAAMARVRELLGEGT